jgi:hypothetical protein
MRHVLLGLLRRRLFFGVLLFGPAAGAEQLAPTCPATVSTRSRCATA